MGLTGFSGPPDPKSAPSREEGEQPSRSHGRQFPLYAAKSLRSTRRSNSSAGWTAGIRDGLVWAVGGPTVDGSHGQKSGMWFVYSRIRGQGLPGARKEWGRPAASECHGKQLLAAVRLGGITTSVAKSASIGHAWVTVHANKKRWRGAEGKQSGRIGRD